MLDGEDVDAFVKRCGPNPATIAQLGSVVEVMMKIGHAQKGLIEAQKTQIEALQAEVLALKQENADREYKGVYDAGVVYRKHNTVTHQGSTWHANVDTMRKPGESDDSTLAVKRGRDGRDAKNDHERRTDHVARGRGDSPVGPRNRRRALRVSRRQQYDFRCELDPITDWEGLPEPEIVARVVFEHARRNSSVVVWAAGELMTLTASISERLACAQRHVRAYLASLLLPRKAA